MSEELDIVLTLLSISNLPFFVYNKVRIIKNVFSRDLKTKVLDRKKG